MTKEKTKKFVEEMKEEEQQEEKKQTKKESKKDEEEKSEKKKDLKELFNKIINIVLWIVLFVWMGICITDFIRTKMDKAPIFTFKKSTNKYDDGTVDGYLGLGYRIYNYKRTSLSGMEYGPFWISEEQPKNN